MIVEPDDEDFLRHLHATTRADELAWIGGEEQRKGFLDLQYRALSRGYAEANPRRPRPGADRRRAVGPGPRRPQRQLHPPDRSAAYRMAVVGTQHNPVIRAHYLRKRAQGRTAMNALGHRMSKSLAIVWGVWRSGRDFDPTLEGPELDKTLWVLAVRRT